MNKKTLAFIAISLFGAPLALYLSTFHDMPTPGAEKIMMGEQEGVHRAEPFDRDFYETVAKFPKAGVATASGEIVAGVAPHHLLAADIISRYYDQFAVQDINSLNIDTVVLIGPNHFGAGEKDFLTSDLGWQTPYGKLEIDLDALDELSFSMTELEILPEAFDKEHAVSSHVAFIKKTFPHAKFLPIILSHRCRATSTMVLVEQLLELSKHRRMLVLASVDFSHYKDSDTAIVNDRHSLEVIASKKFDEVWGLDVDSPASIFALMNYSERKKGEWQLLENSNSALLLGDDEIGSTTSYVTGVFGKSGFRQ